MDFGDINIPVKSRIDAAYAEYMLSIRYMVVEGGDAEFSPLSTVEQAWARRASMGTSAYEHTLGHLARVSPVAYKDRMLAGVPMLVDFVSPHGPDYKSMEHNARLHFLRNIAHDIRLLEQLDQDANPIIADILKAAREYVPQGAPEVLCFDPRLVQKMDAILLQETVDFVKNKMRELSQRLPYSEEFGGLNFVGANEAVVVNIEVKCGDKYLALERSPVNDDHVGQLNNVAGYMQGRGDVSLIETIGQELGSEVKIRVPFEGKMIVGRPIEVVLKDRRLHVIPVQIEFDEEPYVEINEEHEAHHWLEWDDYASRNIVPVVTRVHQQLDIDVLSL